MRLTRFTDYSLRALVYLGQNVDKRVTITEISEAYGISKNHLMKVISNLTRIGVVAARRGPGGGIQLNQPSEDISLDKIIRNTEKHLQALVDTNPDEQHGSATDARMQRYLQQALQAYLEVLGRYTLADILDNQECAGELSKLGEIAA